jgi:hypothetical protein
MRTIHFLFLAGLAAVALVACRPGTPQVEGMIEREMARVLGPADRYTVRIDGLEVDRGRARTITAVGAGVRPPNLPPIERVDAVLSDVAYDRGRGRLSDIGSARVDVRVAAVPLQTFLEQHRNLQDVRVQFASPQRIQLQARPQFEGVDVPAGATLTVAGQLVPKGTQVHFNVETVRVAGVTLPAAVAQRISQEINPVVDLGGMPVVLEVTGIRVEGQTMIATAGGRYPNPVFRGPVF